MRIALLGLGILGFVLSGCLSSNNAEAQPQREPGHAQLGGADSPADAKGARLPASQHPKHVLKSDRCWQLSLPRGQQFDASALLFRGTDLLTVNDRGSTLYRIDFVGDTNVANLVEVPDAFTPKQLAGFRKPGRYDSEGIAQDAQGRLYICEESDRWILRFDPKRGEVERLNIDWAPVRKYFHAQDLNASFEGIAVGGTKLYVANERQLGRIIVVDLASLRVIDDFSVRPAGSNARDIHYSDLCWFEDSLFVLLRDSRCVLKVDPETHQVLAEYSFSEMSRRWDVVYGTLYPTGNMEGLAVDAAHIWLVTDNNGLARLRYPGDIRPTLFRCRRPDVK